MSREFIGSVRPRKQSMGVGKAIAILIPALVIILATGGKAGGVIAALILAAIMSVGIK